MIEANNLCMYYGSFLALDSVSFRAKDNEILGLLGPNGAGKSTLMRILTTFIYPAKGKVTICGFDVTGDPLSVRKIIGYLPENPPLYMDMRVDEFIDFVGKSRGLFGRQLKKRKEWVIEALGICSVYKHIIYELSLGYRQRVGIAQALLHDPKVIILDEPTAGLDPMQIVSIRNLIKGLSSNKTIIFSTHILQEASSISDRLMIIDRGRLIAEGTADDLKKEGLKEKLFFITIGAPRQIAEDALKLIPGLQSFNFIKEDASGTRFLCAVSSYEEALAYINNIIRQKNLDLKELNLKEQSLEEVFMSLFVKKT
ncbi:MAG: ATP-binding cassette domain-containing protein [Candidatus Omnitrophica bacterium]|nr:ATP-binding cassette domain-containing protein [Candidatus Omnitrophota bacterium]